MISLLKDYRNALTSRVSPTNSGTCSAETTSRSKANANKIATIVEILKRPETHADFFIMQDLLIEHDENIALWRYNHVLMVERMLGMKRGTGGSEGAGYLRTTLSKKFFPELWEARTHL